VRVVPDSIVAKAAPRSGARDKRHSTPIQEQRYYLPTMPVPTALDPRPTRFVRSLTQAGNVAKVTIPPSLAKILGWRLRDLLIIELLPDNTLSIRKLDPPQPPPPTPALRR